MNWLHWLVHRFYGIRDTVKIAVVQRSLHGDVPRKPKDRWGQSRIYDWSHQGADERWECKNCGSVKVDDHFFSAYIILSKTPCSDCQSEHDQPPRH